MITIGNNVFVDYLMLRDCEFPFGPFRQRIYFLQCDRTLVRNEMRISSNFATLESIWINFQINHKVPRQDLRFSDCERNILFYAVIDSLILSVGSWWVWHARYHNLYSICPLTLIQIATHSTSLTNEHSNRRIIGNCAETKERNVARTRVTVPGEINTAVSFQLKCISSFP